MDSAINERLIALIKRVGESQHSFSRKIGVPQSRISMIIARGSDISSDTLLKISKAYPESNIEWLLTGQGEMLKEANNASTHSGSNENIVSRVFDGVSWEKYEEMRDKYVAALEENIRLKDKLYELENTQSKTEATSKKERNAI